MPTLTVLFLAAVNKALCADVVVMQKRAIVRELDIVPNEQFQMRALSIWPPTPKLKQSETLRQVSLLATVAQKQPANCDKICD